MAGGEGRTATAGTLSVWDAAWATIGERSMRSPLLEGTAAHTYL